jgi:lipopolysaccharide transport system ATP-binding protein
MAAPIAITLDGVGKRYKIGQYRAADDVLVERVNALLRLPGRRGRDRAADGPDHDAPPADDEFWGLRDVTFELGAGQALGLIGRNGAGKTTLLKLLSRITPPTTGEIRIRGRCSSLLEVGTGFHPELTGRDNVYLNGAILGMRRKEIDRKFDAIVEFSGVERFLDTPVKRYSSGMYMRLAFSVAAHLDPEVLMIDEVLAVGDAEFQRKCLGKMREETAAGRTIIFVSHNLNAVQRLCSRVLLLDSGRVRADGPPAEIVGRYLAGWRPTQGEGIAVVPDDAVRVGSGQVRIRSLAMSDLDGGRLAAVYLGQPFRLTARIEVFEPIEEAIIEFGLSNSEGTRLVTAMSSDGGRLPLQLDEGLQEVSVTISTTLLPHDLQIDAGVHRGDGATADMVEGAYTFRALNTALDSEDQYAMNAVRGYVRPEAIWSEPSPVGELPLASSR